LFGDQCRLVDIRANGVDLVLQSCAKVSFAAVKMLDGRNTTFALLSGRTGRDRKMHLNRES